MKKGKRRKKGTKEPQGDSKEKEDLLFELLS